MFTHFDEKNLKGLLATADIPLSFTTLILDSVQNNKHQLACETYFQCVLKERQMRTLQYHGDGHIKDDEIGGGHYGFEMVTKACNAGVNLVLCESEPDGKRAKKELCADNLCDAEHATGNPIHVDGMGKPSTSEYQGRLGKQTELQVLKTTLNNEGASNENQIEEMSICDLGNEVNIEKPSDYFFSYMQLIRGLHLHSDQFVYDKNLELEL